MRGKVLYPFNPFFLMRITPAYAGKSFLYCKFFPLDRDHPRLCGEKQRSQIADSRSVGSPPPMRGKGGYYSAFFAHKRITPAYAGKSFFWCRGRYSRQDHPRLCGEKGWCILCDASMIGSPPPMRGKVTMLDVTPAAPGITPAYAGKRQEVGKLDQNN